MAEHLSSSKLPNETELSSGIRKQSQVIILMQINDKVYLFYYENTPIQIY